MTRTFLAATSAIALMAGVAVAQTADQTQPTDQPPVIEQTPTTPDMQPTQPDAGTGAAGDTMTDTAPDTETDTMLGDAPDTATEPMMAAGDPVSASDLMGRNVVGADGENIGSVDDVIFDSNTGEIRQVVLASGGFLGLGQKKIAVDFDEIEVQPGMGVTARALTQADVENLPDFDVAEATRSLDVEPAAAPAQPAAPAPAPGTGG